MNDDAPNTPLALFSLPLSLLLLRPPTSRSLVSRPRPPSHSAPSDLPPRPARHQAPVSAVSYSIARPPAPPAHGNARPPPACCPLRARLPDGRGPLRASVRCPQARSQREKNPQRSVEKAAEPARMRTHGRTAAAGEAVLSPVVCARISRPLRRVLQPIGLELAAPHAFPLFRWAHPLPLLGLTTKANPHPTPQQPRQTPHPTPILPTTATTTTTTTAIITTSIITTIHDHPPSPPPASQHLHSLTLRLSFFRPSLVGSSPPLP
ncbi:hypothetical protein DFH27DRAFT_649392 [Peziza echinospora]|nr:hypothetical protein DFH27DRAFT_649392 [Peziza echinospora]